ncbi:MAG: pyrroloquinoline quinone biosynthesis protein PqqB [Rubrivivax sp.]
MRLTILGSAAGGGFPQWNCNCRNCSGLRAGTLRAKPRTQSSIFVQGVGPEGLLVNASPDILQQVRAQPGLQPARGLRDSAIAGVLLIDGQVDHATGLLMLRERMQPLPLWCTDPVAEDLTRGLPLLAVLGHFCGVARERVVPDGRAFEVPALPGLQLRAFALASKAAPYSPHRESPVAGDNIGVVFADRASGRSVFYAPGLGEITPALFDVMCGADAVLVDGTFWTDDEMIALGLARKTARDIGHLPQSGPGGMIEWLDRLPAHVRRLLIHVNNTNPILDEDSPERARLAAHGIEVCEDGMTLDF